MTETPKDLMRQEAVRHRDRLDMVARDFERAATNFMETVSPKVGDVVALYWPKGREFDTLPLMEQLWAAGAVCALPVIVPGERVLRFAVFNDDDELVEGKFGVMQPRVHPGAENFVTPNVFVVPLLAFDRRGHRLGYGGGYYDATLQYYRGSAPVTAVGYAYAEQAVLFNLPAEQHDEKLDYVVTPQAAHCFKI